MPEYKLSIKYDERHEAKKLIEAEHGAGSVRYDKQNGYLLNTEKALRTEDKAYLAPKEHKLKVPYSEKDRLKKHCKEKYGQGALTYNKTDGFVLKTNEPLTDNVKQYVFNPKLDTPVKTEQLFSDALSKMGVPDTELLQHPICDGKKHRISVVGDKAGQKSGSYTAHLDGVPNITIYNFRTGESITEVSQAEKQTVRATPEVIEQLMKKTNEKRAARKAEIGEATFENENICKFYKKQRSSLSEKIYTHKSGIKPSKNTLYNDAANSIFLPMEDKDGNIKSAQYIAKNGFKSFVKDTQREGSFHILDGREELDKVPVVVVSEGYSTASALKQDLGYTTVASMGGNNLDATVKAMKEIYPDKPILVVGDNDEVLVHKIGQNQGKVYAENAAKNNNVYAYIPTFDKSENKWPEHLEKVTPEIYRAGNLTNEQKLELEKQSEKTDYYDLKFKSSVDAKSQLENAVEKAKTIHDLNKTKEQSKAKEKTKEQDKSKEQTKEQNKGQIRV